MFGYKFGSPRRYATFGQGSGPIYMDNVQCRGNEPVITNCSYSGWETHNCRHYEDAGVTCFNYDKAPTVQLVGSGPRSGRVQISFNGQTGTICDNSWSNNDARVVCKTMGFVDGIAFKGSYYGRGSGAIFLDRLYCNGREGTIFGCPNRGWTIADRSCTDHSKDASVVCYNEEVSISLINGPTGNQGIVQITIDGRPGTLCGSTFSSTSAKVLCKQMGYLDGTAQSRSLYGNTTGFSYMYQPSCDGTESKIWNCKNQGWNVTTRYCAAHNNDARLRLNGTKRGYGRAEVAIDGVWGRMCTGYSSYYTANAVCKQLGFTGGNSVSSRSSGRGRIYIRSVSCNSNAESLNQCSISWGTTRYCRELNVQCYGRVRLTNGNHLSTGSIEVNINNNWGSVCDHNWKAANTRVACKQLGYDDGLTACCSAYGNHPKAIIENVNCAGTESRLQDCTHDNPHKSSCYQHNVAVICYKGTKPTTYTWKLGGGNNYTGEVLVDYMGTTGRICSDNWDDNDARVVCKALGFRNGTAYNHARFDYYYASHGPFWLNNVGCTGSEATLNDCPLPTTPLGGVSKCNSGKAAGVLCADISGIYYRINGPQDNMGRVEVSVNGVWGSICNTGFDNREANVFCRTLGYSDGRAQVVSYPNPSGPVFKSNFQCTGDENNLAACPHQGWLKATDYRCSNHRRDASIICYDQVRLATGFGPDIKQGPVQYYSNGTWNLVCDTNFNDLSAKRICQDIGFFDGKAICCSAYGIGFQFWYNGGYRISNMTMACTGNEKSSMECLQESTCESQNYASAICFNDTDVINENYDFHFHDSTDKSGRIEVSHYNTKGRICSTFWDDTNARVYCKKRGYPDGIAYHSSRWTWTSVTERGPFWVGSMNCTGSEPSLKNCSFTDRLTLGNCSQADVGAVSCFDDTSGIQYRLAGGDKKEGRVEISVGGVWGTVCDLFWDKREAGVLCRSLGYSDGYSVRGAHYGPGSGPVWLSRLRCTGTETDLHRCPHNGFQSEVVDGSTYSWRKCQSHDDDASVVCVDKLKLNLGLNASMGAVEVYVSPSWLGVCDDGFDDNAAAVVCRTMGYPNGVKLPGSSFGVTDGPIGVTKVKCSAVMKTFSQCAQTISRTCPSGLYASVYCSMDDIVDDGIKVELDPDSTSGQSGLVKVHKGGVWGSVCMAGIDKVFATVACREFGFGGGIPYTSREKDIRPILMADVKCNGAERSLKDCSYTAKSKNNWCDYYAPRAGVLCYNTSIQFRLTGDTDKSRGRIEMNVDGQWGAFCNSWTDSRIGRVVCKQQGFVDGIMVSGNKYISPDDEPMWYTSTRCIGNESSITTCSSDGFQYNGYYRRYYEWACRRRTGPISVQCYNQEFKISQLRLADGTNSSGRVEVFLEGPNQWGTVCDDYWSDVDATVVCNQLGFATGTAIKRAAVFGQGTGQIWLDDVACTGSEMNLKDCPSNGFSVHNCQHTEDAGVTCKGVYVPPTTPPIVSTKPTGKGGPVTEQITGGKSGSDSGTAAAIAVPIVIIIIVGAVLGFLYYKRYGNRFKDLREDLVDEAPKHGGGGVSLRPSGAFFSKFRSGGASSSAQPGVTNPSYEFAQPSTFSPESDS
ncbi:hypothetical protein LOTGIDRAFT_216664 [Lottia gigantea]|uniref:SRCR domain-containing protein n=1 Tax=Lottia gigantea TaxID=225164 RepID=V4AGP4_LOTGI|nr:hypothetical protein LOTGIDRAFT_216664 [Lottia gigantea]ESO92591.1 hypothetical protein LOTGIDRAFT_216664 [Lottia gigantea]